MPLPPGPGRQRALLVGAVAWLGASATAAAQSRRAEVSAAHRHPGAARLSPEVDIPGFALVDTVLVRNTEQGPLVTDRRRRFDAFTIGDTLIVVVERRTGNARVIRGIPFEWRPLVRLEWTDSRTLVFDRWSSPHFGVHYAVDVVRGRLVAALAFNDLQGAGRGAR